MSTPIFREDDYESFLYDEISKQETVDYLQPEEPGTFFLRKSLNMPGDIILCVKEVDQVIQCPITHARSSMGKEEWFLKGRDETKFGSISSILAFYKRHNLVSINLISPIAINKIPRDPVNPTRRRPSTRLTLPDNPRPISCSSCGSLQNSPRGSLFLTSKLVHVVTDYRPDMFAKHSLELEVGDLVRVTKERLNGTWEGVILYPLAKAGNAGEFPFKTVEVIENFFQDQDGGDNLSSE